MTPALVVMILSGLATVALTPLAKRLAFALGAVDHPGGRQKTHERQIPRLGGVAIFLSVILSLTAASLIFPKGIPRLGSGALLGLLVGSGCIFLLGVYDDMRGANAPTKLALQVAAAGLLYFSGVRILAISTHFGWMVTLGVLSLPFTVLWLVGLTNGMNLLDGIDGLATGVAAIATLTILLVALGNGRTQISLIAAALLGSLLAFLLFNFHPAQIYLGDCGAMFLGFLLAAISVLGNQKSASAVAMGVPIIALGIPIFDTVLALVRRLLRGKHPFQGDRDHLHHRLLALGLSQPRVAIMLYAVSGLLAVMALLMAKATQAVASVIVLCLGLAVIAAVQWMSAREFRGWWHVVRNGGRRHRALLVRNALPVLARCETDTALRHLLEEVRRGLGFQMLRVRFEAGATPPVLNGTSELLVGGADLSGDGGPGPSHPRPGWSGAIPILLGQRVVGEVAATKPTWRDRRIGDPDEELLRVLADGVGSWVAAHQPHEDQSPAAR